jgi:ABC-type branched-subunit amino acid transport system substrate-binding protein
MSRVIGRLRTSTLSVVASGALALTACGTTVPLTGPAATGSGQTGTQVNSLGEPVGAPVAPGATTVDQAGAPAVGGPATTTGGSVAVPTGQAPTGPRASVPALSSSAPVPPTGRGWDRKYVYVGMTTQKDVNTVAQTAGINSVDAGDQEADAEAVVKHLNAKGGLFGRQIKVQYFDVSSAGDAETQAQAACAFFTQDHPVVAVYAAALVADTPTFRSCLAKARIPAFAGGDQAFDDKVFNDLGGYYNLMPFPSWNRFAPHFVDRLVAQKYYTGWDTTLGKAGTAPVKVGILCPDTTVGRRVGAILTKELVRVGRAPTSTIYYTTNSSDVNGYVLKFQSEKVTHVLFCDLGLFVFATAAESQHYRPRYGVSTFNTPVLFLQGVVPAAQLTGATGSGFVPTLDVDDAHDPGPTVTPAARECREIAAKNGVNYPPQKRFARAVLYDTCDILNVIAASAKAGGGPGGPSIRAGISVAGPGLRSAVTFVSGLSDVVHAMPAATRDVFYDSPCGCFRYQGHTRAMT